MAWLETCRIDAGKQIKELKSRGLSIRQAVKKLSLESGIPENTINNWIYERTASRKHDAFYFMLETIRNDMAVEGWTEDKLKKIFEDGEIIVKWALLWLTLEGEEITGWYRAAFEKYGKSAKITDMFRTGMVWCDCPNCDGKVRKKAEPRPSMNPALFTPKGYVNFNVI